MGIVERKNLFLNSQCAKIKLSKKLYMIIVLIEHSKQNKFINEIKTYQQNQ